MPKAHNTADKDQEFNLPETTLTSDQVEDLLIKSRIKMLLTRQRPTCDFCHMNMAPYVV